MAFPGSHTLQRFFANTSVGPDTRATYWLLCIKSDVQKVEELLATLEADTQHCVYPAKRYAETLVFVPLQWDCTFAQLETVFGTPLLGKVIQEHCFQKLNNFLLGAKGTKIEEWGMVFSTADARFCQLMLNKFALELKINSIAILVSLYSELSLLFDTRKCSRMKIFITEKEAETLYKAHSSNSVAFQKHSRQLSFAKVAIQFKKYRVDELEYLTQEK